MSDHELHDEAMDEENIADKKKKVFCNFFIIPILF